MIACHSLLSRAASFPVPIKTGNAGKDRCAPGLGNTQPLLRLKRRHVRSQVLPLLITPEIRGSSGIWYGPVIGLPQRSRPRASR